MFKDKKPTLQLRSSQYKGAVDVIEYRDTDHTPFTKRPGSVDSVVTFKVHAPAHQKWVQFDMTETTTTGEFGGKRRTQTRTITTSIDYEMVEKIAAFILNEKAAQS